MLSELVAGFSGDTAQFIESLQLGTDADLYKANIENVSLMTLHASKGLEFKCVFIAGCEDGLLPYQIFENHKADIDEERRLLYVGMTRAEKYLYLSHAQRRFIFNKEYALHRSPFIDKIEKELIEQSQAGPKKKQKKDDGQMSLF
jgi:DNA helicase II / ATP-dependent DNA helicase PcrA